MIPTGWTEKTLGEITDIISGTTPDTTKKEFWGKGNFWITPAELTENQIYVTSTQRELTDLAIKTCSLRPMPRGTVIFSSRAPIGKMAISDVDVLYCNQGFKNFVCHEDLYNKFLFYFLVYNKEYLISLGKGTTFKEVSKAIISQVKICYPSILEQQRIVEKLDTLFADIEKEKQIAQKNLQNAKELFESGIQKLCLNSCGDNVVKVGDILSLEYGKALERQQRSETGKYLVYGANGPIGRTDQYLCEGKTIIVGRKGSVGEIVVALENNWPVDVTYWVKFDSNLYDFDFLYYLLRGLKLQSMAKGVKPGLNRNDVYALKVRVPQSINEQRNIAQKLNKLHEQSQELERIYTKQIVDLYELKQAILKKAFNGEL